jgi:hypothetical protein
MSYGSIFSRLGPRVNETTPVIHRIQHGGVNTHHARQLTHPFHHQPAQRTQPAQRYQPAQRTQPAHFLNHMSSSAKGNLNEVRGRLCLRKVFGEENLAKNLKYYRPDGSEQFETDVEVNVIETSTNLKKKMIVEIKSSLHKQYIENISNQIKVRLSYFPSAIVVLYLPTEDDSKEFVRQQIAAFRAKYPELDSEPRLRIIDDISQLQAEFKRI